MAKKLTGWKTKGMNRDLSVSAFNPEFAFENRNLRLATNDGNTLMSWVNEKGTEQIYLYIDENPWEERPLWKKTSLFIKGTPIGTAVVDNKLVIFTTEAAQEEGDPQIDRIYVLWYTQDKTKMMGKMLYSGSLGFSTKHPIETLVSYEAENIQKVYWVDGINQPRVINIEATTYKLSKWNDPGATYSSWFDFVPELQLGETITVLKKLGAGGMFASGVIQYAFTYYNKYGQESNIFHVTPLYYISFSDRGASPEEKVDNAFQITVENPDTNFDYLRIYSIQRTSIDGTPLCKRIQDIELRDFDNNKVSYLDTGTSGDTVDPTELLYKGGEAIIAETIEQKDGTLFFGNISIKRDNLQELKVCFDGKSVLHPSARTIKPEVVSFGDYEYACQLNSKVNDGDYSTPCAGFKVGNYYRCGIQFQHTTGKWSEPFFINDTINTGGGYKPGVSNNSITLPTFEATIQRNLNGIDIKRTLLDAGYKKARAVVVYPSVNDRAVICQGVACPTVYTQNHRGHNDETFSAGYEPTNDLYAQSSWFFRVRGEENTGTDKTVWPISTSGTLQYTSKELSWNPEHIREVEVQGQFDYHNRFKIDTGMCTLHSPDICFDDTMLTLDFNSVYEKCVGKATISKTFSDIDIQTETPTISNGGSGFTHKSFIKDKMYGIVAGLFYDDFPVDDGDDSGPKVYENIVSPVKWMVYPWNKDGSLNNDINRPANKGVASAVLKKKIISNLRYFDSTTYNYNSSANGPKQAGLFSSDNVTSVRLKEKGVYKGNIDTVLVPDDSDGQYFAFNHDNMEDKQNNIVTSFTSDDYWWKTFNNISTEPDKQGQYMWNYNSENKWVHRSDYIGDAYLDLVLKKDLVRMKYKSTPHLVLEVSNGMGEENKLPVIDITRGWDSEPSNLFGGKSPDAKRENVWVPCGNPVDIVDNNENIKIKYEWGDTYYQRWDCLKTYAFTTEDKNQIVEIGSFMLETYVNIDGRYDRNRGQSSNLYMSPINFNLINPVYSQINNFFSYRIMDDSYYENTAFPNQVTWSKTKESGADVDMWTNVTLASVLELDGDKGVLNRIERFNNQLIAFQDTGTSQILYNENTQVTTEQGVPVEIGNSKKVDGKRYLSDTIGCSNKWSIVSTPVGIYFMDSYNKSIFLFNGQFNNLSGSLGFNAWSKQNIPAVSSVWNPVDFDAFVSYYDKLNQDVLFINKDMALAYSERLGTFTSFYDYGKAPYFVNLEDTGIWINQSQIENEGQLADSTYYLWKHQDGADYCKFFDVQHPYWTVLIGNPEPQMDKIFTNLEFRACVDGDGSVENEKFTPYLPFDYIETWNEYQHGLANIGIRNGHDLFKHHPRDLSEPKAFDASLIRKFRTWRCDIPRSNASLERDEGLNCYRKDVRPQDRMRNPWLYLKLMKNANSSNKRAEIHDVVMTYFD